MPRNKSALFAFSASFLRIWQPSWIDFPISKQQNFIVIHIIVHILILIKMMTFGVYVHSHHHRGHSQGGSVGKDDEWPSVFYASPSAIGWWPIWAINWWLIFFVSSLNLHRTKIMITCQQTQLAWMMIRRRSLAQRQRVWPWYQRLVKGKIRSLAQIQKLSRDIFQPACTANPSYMLYTAHCVCVQRGGCALYYVCVVLYYV